MKRAVAALLAALLTLGFAGAASASPTSEVLAYVTAAGVVVNGSVVAPEANDVGISRDGSRITFTHLEDESWLLWVAKSDGSQAKAITKMDPGNQIYDPQFSPDGRQIAYTYGGGDVFTLRIIPASGGTAFDIPDTERTREPTWSPDGAFLAAAQDGGLLVVTPDGTQRTTIPAPSGHAYENPAWSPDGKTLLLDDETFGTDGEDFSSHLAAYSFSSGAMTDLDTFTSSAAWTADGTAYYDKHTLTGGYGSADEELERRTADGVLDTSFTPVHGADEPADGGSGHASSDTTAPGPVTDLTATPAPSTVTLSSTLPVDTDRAGVIVRYAMGTDAPATTTEGMAGPRSPSGTAVVKRLLPDTTYSFSVFALDWSGNPSPPTTVTATTPHQVMTTFRTRVTAAHDINRTAAAVYGDTAVASARLIREDTGAYVQGQTVQLLGHTYGQPDKVLATAVTDHDGLVRFIRRPTATAAYTLRYAGDGQLLPGAGTHRVKVILDIRTHVTPSSSTRGGQAVLEVLVRPRIPGLHIQTTQVFQGRSVAGHVAVLDQTGRAFVAVDTGRAGLQTLYVYAPAHADYASQNVPQLYRVR